MKVMKVGQAPGKYGLGIKFYKEYWEIVGPSLLMVRRDTLNKGSLSKNLNASIIKLIPKCADKDSLSKWRPLIMLNCSYKIIAKVLDRKLKDKRHHWIRLE